MSDSPSQSVPSMETLVSLAKRRGFVYAGSEIYGGLAGTFDYGPLGVALKRNIEQLWWRRFIEERDDMFGIDAAILMNPKAWEASGHVSGFSDPLVECGNCKKRFRADHLINENFEIKYKEYLVHLLDFLTRKISDSSQDLHKLSEALQSIVINSESASKVVIKKEVWEELNNSFRNAESESVGFRLVQNSVNDAFLYKGPFARKFLLTDIDCPNCSKKEWGEPKQFNMMFKTQVGAMEDDSSTVYLRPETAAGMFVNFKNVVDSLHPKLPFGLGQIGKAFRNEIAPRDFIFRVRELEQMEVEYFVRPSDWEAAFQMWRERMHAFGEEIGLPTEKLHELEVEGDDLAHYSERTIDFEFDYPFGRKELWGLAYRTDFDLKAHSESSTQQLQFLDEETGERITPHVIEPSLGVGRTLLAVLASAYREDELGGETRTYLAFSPKVAPVKAMVSPLLKNKPELVEKAREVRAELRRTAHTAIAWDDNGNIGKRYRRQDEIGTPFCITIDFDTIGQGADNPALAGTVTLRHRDTGEQERLTVAEVAERIRAATT